MHDCSSPNCDTSTPKSPEGRHAPDNQQPDLHLPWERLIAIGLLGIGGIVLANLNAATVGIAAAVVLFVSLGVETTRHRDELRRLRATAHDVENL